MPVSGGLSFEAGIVDRFCVGELPEVELGLALNSPDGFLIGYMPGIPEGFTLGINLVSKNGDH